MDPIERVALNRAQAALSVMAGTTPSYAAATEFGELLRALAAGGGQPTQALPLVPRHLSRVADVLKSAVTGGGLSSWGSNVGPFQQLVDGFQEYARPNSGFDTMLPSMRRAPSNTRLAIATSGASGSNVSEGAAIPISKLALATVDLPPLRAAVLVAVTKELLRFSSAASLLNKQLAIDLGTTVTLTFLTTVLSGAPTHAATGNSAAQILADLTTLAADLAISAGSQLFLLMSPTNALKLSLKPLATTLPFPFRVVPTDALSASVVVLVDADGILADDVGLSIDASENAALEMSSTPSGAVFSGSPQTPTATNLVAMFSSDSVAIRAVRRFACQRFRAAASQLTGVSW